MIKIETNSISVFDLKISPAQNSFAAGLIEAPLKVYSIADGKELLSIKDRKYDSAWAVDWYMQNDSTYLLAGYGTNGYIRIFDSAGENVLRYLRNSRDVGFPDAASMHTNSIWRIKVIGDQLFSVSDDKKMSSLKLAWNGTHFEFGGGCAKYLVVNKPVYEFLHWKKNTGFITDDDGTIYQVHLRTMKIITSFQGHTNRVVSLAKMDEKHLISFSWDKSIKLWDITTGEIIKELVLENAGYKIMVFQNSIFHTDGNYIVERDKETWEKISEHQHHKCELRIFDITSDGEKMVLGYNDGVIVIISLNL